MTDLELSVQVAYRVMGWSAILDEAGSLTGYQMANGVLPTWAWNPSEFIVDAWKVMERLQDRERPYLGRFDGLWNCSFGGHSVRAVAETAPRAICHAALNWMDSVEGKAK